jgi:hypothetical protein
MENPGKTFVVPDEINRLQMIEEHVRYVSNLIEVLECLYSFRSLPPKMKRVIESRLKTAKEAYESIIGHVMTIELALFQRPSEIVPWVKCEFSSPSSPFEKYEGTLQMSNSVRPRGVGLASFDENSLRFESLKSCSRFQRSNLNYLQSPMFGHSLESVLNMNLFEPAVGSKAEAVEDDPDLVSEFTRPQKALRNLAVEKKASWQGGKENKVNALLKGKLIKKAADRISSGPKLLKRTASHMKALNQLLVEHLKREGLEPGSVIKFSHLKILALELSRMRLFKASVTWFKRFCAESNFVPVYK